MGPARAPGTGGTAWRLVDGEALGGPVENLAAVGAVMHRPEGNVGAP
jgi:hypothetical protein